MGRLLVALVAANGFWSCAEVEAPSTERPRSDVVAFVDVSVVPMDRERVLENRTVLVEGNRIASIGGASELDVPEGAMRIEGAGRYLMPGLVEMHGHLPSPSMPEEVTDNVLFLYVANGVTTVRGMQGNPSQLELRARIDRGELTGPRLILGSPSMNGGNVETVEEARALVREYDQAGFDLLKVHEGLTAEIYDAIAETANEVGIPFAGHVTDHVGLFHALEAGQATIDHLDNYVEALVPEERMPAEPPGLRGTHELVDLVDPSRIEQVVEATLEADAGVVPTMVLWESGIFPLRPSSELLVERTETRYMPKDTVAAWVDAVDEARRAMDADAVRELAELRRDVLHALHRGGARVLLGTDSPQIFSVPGFSIHREMALYVEVGMSPYEVLSSGTRAVGEFYEADFGTVTEGARADLILVEGNPLDDVGNVARRVGVLVGGRWLPEVEIQARLQRIAESYASR